jgi:hypothetical protein
MYKIGPTQQQKLLLRNTLIYPSIALQLLTPAIVQPFRISIEDGFHSQVLSKSMTKGHANFMFKMRSKARYKYQSSLVSK